MVSLMCRLQSDVSDSFKSLRSHLVRFRLSKLFIVHCPRQPEKKLLFDNNIAQLKLFKAMVARD